MSFQTRMPAEGESLIGQPTKPDRARARVLAGLLAPFPKVEEAHFPQCFAPGKMTRPAQVLMIVFSDPQGAQEAMPRIQERVAQLIPSGDFVDMWPITTAGGLLGSVRGARCRILRRTPSGAAVIEDPWSLWDRAIRCFRRPT
jgi:hypothetical protein